MKIHPVPVIAIDGPSASGKGTIAQRVANELNYHYLDSGALYRLVALKAMQCHTDLTDQTTLATMATQLDVVFAAGTVRLEGTIVADAIRTEQCGILASKIAAYPPVRDALLSRQHAFRLPPGLVTDGRDMGSVVFPDATLKIFLTASAEVRAERRYKQLKEKGISATIPDLLQDIQKRDARDRNRSVAPLQQNSDARILDTTSLSVIQVLNKVIAWYTEVCASK
ncbi:cytidylate kinase [Nitrosomonas cryotolerans]|uniref:Cytidylate kinase n=1 Tax=Nitrosomonas cryotolerans ATCC 49181 TaxID=1131553 RepID=A0A1N6GXT9_9PROT|nr:(d)CMP kinase [Nitrosomonas cryotolerans]SFP42439.1 cytidylate kinase [Nitrosomonas cryotolerans]SIO12373.1 cytidylate kinase [Nitrosomonas cryotolerans ATCC 49181]